MYFIEFVGSFDFFWAFYDYFMGALFRNIFRTRLSVYIISIYGSSFHFGLVSFLVIFLRKKCIFHSIILRFFVLRFTSILFFMWAFFKTNICFSFFCDCAFSDKWFFSILKYDFVYWFGEVIFYTNFVQCLHWAAAFSHVSFYFNIIIVMDYQIDGF